MKNLLCDFTILFLLVLGECFSSQIVCNNVFKCISSTKFKICVNNELISWEFTCPESSYCIETSKDICTKSHIPNAEPAVEPATNRLISTIGNVCTEQGKFPIPNTGCRSFISCASTSTGFRSKEYTCPEGFLFDPNTQRCKNSYVCPESILVTKRELKSQVSTLPTPITRNVIPGVDFTTQSTDLSKCKENNKLTVPNSACGRYVQCSVTLYGIREKEYTCPFGLVFDPKAEICSSSYICPQLNTSSILRSASLTAEPTICKENGKIPVHGTNCQEYFLCYKTSLGFVAKDYPCPNGFLFDPSVQRCSSSYVCKDVQPSKEILPIKSANVDDNIISADLFVCVEEGKFPALNTNCTNYILCSMTTTGIRGKIYSCPPKFAFNPDLKRCTNSFVCTESTSVNSINSEATTESVMTNPTDPEALQSTCSMSNVFIIPECVQDGRFPIMGSDCKQYILCSVSTTGFKSEKYTCPNNTAFDPNNRRCAYKFECTELLNSCGSVPPTPLVTTPTSGTTIATVVSPVPECKHQGRMPISSSSCKSYLLCIWTNNGFASSTYNCPNATYFNPETGRCTTNYICGKPVNRNKRHTLPVCSTVGLFPDSNDNNCKYFYSCSETTRGTVHGIRQKCNDGYYFDPQIQKCSTSYYCKKTRQQVLSNEIINPKILLDGRCTTVGRYLLPGTGCKNYVLCRANSGGTLTATNYTCPTTTAFNQMLQKCTATYNCPDTICMVPGWIPNPNVKDCTSFILCEANFNIDGSISSFTGSIHYCLPGSFYNPFYQYCDPNYVCPK